MSIYTIIAFCFIFLLIFDNMPFQPARVGLHFQIHAITATETTAREFLIQRNVLCSGSVCSRCNNAMTLTPCSEKKSSDLYTWKCLPCGKFTSIRARSVLSGSKLSFSVFVLLVFYFSSKSLTNVEIAAYTGISEEAVGIWRNTLEGSIITWIIGYSKPFTSGWAWNNSRDG